MVPEEEAPANFVPAAAVIRRVRALFGIIGRKGFAGGNLKSGVKSPGSTRDVHLKLGFLSTGEGSGIAGVGVTSVEISRNTGGEGDCLARY